MSGPRTTSRCFVLAVTLSHAHWALTVADSLSEAGNGEDVLLFVTDLSQDDIEARQWPAGPRVRLIGGDRITADGFAASRSYFNGLEFSGPSKIYGLEYAIYEAGYEKAIFLDADIHAIGSFDPVWASLDQVCCVVTPHIAAPLPDDGQSPDDLEIVSYGQINGGFWGVSRHDRLPEILRFMKRNVLKYGFFIPGAMNWAAEQTWMSALPFMFPKETRVLSHPGLNVAYWNMHERNIDLEKDAPECNGQPLVFLHLSGFKPNAPSALTSFNVRAVGQDNMRELRPLLAAKATALSAKQAAMPTVTPSFFCSRKNIGGRLRDYEAVHGRPHPLARRILFASLADKLTNVLQRFSRPTAT